MGVKHSKSKAPQSPDPPLPVCSNQNEDSKRDAGGSLDPLELLNYDGWGLVLHKLNGEDLLSCRRVCKLFHEILNEHEFQQRWKFHLVLPSIFEYLKSDRDADSDLSWDNLHSVRLTCDAWRQSVDKYATEVYKKTVLPDSWTIEETGLMSYCPLSTSFCNTEAIEEFQQVFGESNANPFPSRTVFISNLNYTRSVVQLQLANDQDENLADQRRLAKRLHIPFVKKTGDLLEQFGKYISKLQLFFEIECAGEPLSFCKLMKRITSHLPSLKTLSIINTNMVQNAPIDYEQHVAAFIQKTPLGEMPKLEALQIEYLDPMLEDYILKKYAPQLTQFVRITPRSPLKECHMQQFKTLTELSYFSLSYTDTLEVLRVLESPLKTLKLDFCFSPAFRWEHLNWNVDKVLSNINHLPIECLDVRLGIVNLRGVKVKIMESGLGLKKYINKSIRTLHLQFVMTAEGKVSFNFLEALSKLEELQLTFTPLRQAYKTTHPKEVPKVVNLSKYMMDEEMTGKPYHSNVWKKVPSLKTLIVKRDLLRGDGPAKLKYTRENYEK